MGTDNIIDLDYFCVQLMIIRAFYEMLCHLFCNKGRVHSQPVVTFVPSAINNRIPNNPPSLVRKYANSTRRSNTKYNTKYKILSLEGLRDTLCRCTEVNNDLNTKLSIIIYDVVTPNFASKVLEYFKDGGPMSTGQ